MGRLLLIGLDGATFDLIEPWSRSGKLPTLGRLMAEGAWGPLRSTLPAATFPAWTSLMTGVNPGRHGVLDFAMRVPGSWRIEFVNGSRRRVPALWNRVSAAGRRVAMVTVPATYPPEPVAGAMISGFDSPVATAIDGSFVFPPELFADIRRHVGRVPFADFQEVAIGPGWHDRALTSLLDGIDKRARLVTMLLDREPFDVVGVVFGESDTVGHHFWRFADPSSPRFSAEGPADAIERVYRALDGAVAQMIDRAGPDTTVVLVSDHGSGGAGDEALYLNRRLGETGHLTFAASGTRGVGATVRGLALKAIPARWQGRVLRAFPAAAGRVEGMTRFGGIAWSRTVAYSEELDYHPSVWLNVRGREPHGIVAPDDVPAVRERVRRDLLDWRDAEGRAVIARVTAREAVYHGPATDEAPDLLIEPALVDGYSRSCLKSGGPGPALRRLTRAEHGAGKGAGMNGTHRPDGILIMAGPGVRGLGRIEGREIVDVLPTILTLAGLPIPEGLDGCAIEAPLRAAPRIEPDPLPAGEVVPHAYEAREAQIVADRLAALGYLERPR